LDLTVRSIAAEMKLCPTGQPMRQTINVLNMKNPVEVKQGEEMNGL
jgi:hypothetical protein